MSDRDWTKFGLTNPPENGRQFDIWMEQAFWVNFTLLQDLRHHGCRKWQQVKWWLAGAVVAGIVLSRGLGGLLGLMLGG